MPQQSTSDQRMKINENITVGPQPSETEIAELFGEGFKSVINFRTDGESEQPLSPEQERRHVEAAGLIYSHIPVSMDSMDQSKVDDFREQLKSLPTPIFAHCKSGKRAGAMVMMDVAVKQGMSGEQTIRKAEEMGFECDSPELEQFVKSYVDEHSNS
ncbi:beta-lactamase hydrolase domain-containing protein [Rhodopirellula sp. JC639]|uniref:beta-lactamase hydrolase domain-containing protein n=1 Tax=Stieleria mannarensis TaxID=2755585 RepID=UPI0015FFBB9E|nr:protein tyrosine phosphatase family protein [Rhodopirellula sp. JC639]